jgi:hypothetical protein
MFIHIQEIAKLFFYYFFLIIYSTYFYKFYLILGASYLRTMIRNSASLFAYFRIKASSLLFKHFLLNSIFLFAIDFIFMLNFYKWKLSVSLISTSSSLFNENFIYLKIYLHFGLYLFIINLLTLFAFFIFLIHSSLILKIIISISLLEICYCFFECFQIFKLPPLRLINFIYSYSL